MDPSLVNWALNQGPLLFALLVELWAGAKETPVWVFGRTHRDALKSCETQLADKDRQINKAYEEIRRLNGRLDRWQELSFSLTNLSKDQQALVKDLVKEGGTP